MAVDIAPVELPVVPPADPWTSDSAGSTAESEAKDPASASPDALPPQTMGSEPPIEPDKPANKRKNPYEAVRAATGETARERDLRLAAEDRATKAEARAAELERSQSEKPEARPATRPRPKYDDYEADKAKYPDPFDSYLEDLADWKAEQRLAADLDSRIGSHLEQRQYQERWAQHIGGVNDRGRKAYADFDAQIQSADVVFPNTTLYAIANLDGSEHIQYALATNRELASRIAALDNPILVAAELAKLVPAPAGAVRPDSPPAPRSSTAKPPINRVGGTASAAPVDPDDLDFGPDFIKAGNEADKKRREASRW